MEARLPTPSPPVPRTTIRAAPGATPSTTSAPGGEAGRRRPGLPSAVAALALLAVAVAPAGAQYTPPGTLVAKDRTPPQEEIEERLEEARWDLGAIRLMPWLGIRDVSFVNNVNPADGGGEEEDFTVTVGAGLRGYLKTGSKVFWTAHALPEYVWWRDLEDKRSFNGRYGAAVFGYFNRLTLEASGRRREQQGFFSSEVQELTTVREDTARLALALRVASKLELFAVGQRDDFESQEEESPLFSSLDRDRESAEAGVRYLAPGGFTLALSYEDQSTGFAPAGRDLSNSGGAVKAEVGAEGPKLAFLLDLGFPSYDPEPGSAFRGFDDTLGNLELLWSTGPRLTLLAYARRDLRYALDAASSHYLGDRQGLRIDLRLRPGTFTVFGEIGDDDYEPIVAGATGRLDDVTELGARFTFELRDVLSLSLSVVSSDYDSNFDRFDRDVTTFGFSVELGAVLRKLSLGSQGGVW